MRNPFESFGEPKNKTDLELFEGPWECQDMYCELEAPEAHYSPEASLLTWKCPDGHVSKIEGFSLV